MSPAEFQAETGRLWEQVKPLYDELHCHVRATLGKVYGEDKVPQDGPIPAHLLGNSRNGRRCLICSSPTRVCRILMSTAR